MKEFDPSHEEHLFCMSSILPVEGSPVPNLQDENNHFVLFYAHDNPVIPNSQYVQVPPLQWLYSPERHFT